MGVAGAGKTTVGRALSNALCWTFYDGDELHSAANVDKMRGGQPLTDEDRQPWLDKLNGIVADVERRGTHAVLACSALKEEYRAALLPQGVSEDAVRYVYLDVAPDVLYQRLRDRSHFFPPELLDSQLSTLEKPEDAVRVDGTQPVADIVRLVRESLRV
jgi:gluconokinase